MKSKITRSQFCNIDDDHGNTATIQAEIDDDGSVMGYLFESETETLVFSDIDDLKAFGEAIITYAEAERNSRGIN